MALTRITKGVIKPNENYDTHNINSTGIVTAIGLDVNGNGDISGNLSVGGILTYEDVTSIDSVGIITAQKDIHVGAGVSAVGVGTFGSLDISGDIDVDGHTNLDNVNIAGIATFTNVVTKFAAGNGGNTHLQVLSTGTGEAGIFFDAANGDISGSDYIFIGQQNNLDFVIKANPNAGNIDFQRGTDTKVRIDTSGNLNVNYDLDVDGHTNLDNVSIAGITTTTENIRIQGDNKYLTIGAGNDIGLVHTGGESFITNATGHLTHRSDVHKWENFAGSSEYLRISSGGNIGIGTNNPGQKLQVMGTILKTRSDSGIGLIYLQQDASQNGQVLVNQKDGVERIKLHSSGVSYFNGGNVGIKSTAPRGKLDIGFDGAPSFITFDADADNPKVEFFRHTGGAPSHYATEIQQVLGDLTLSTAAIAYLGGHSYTERLRITSAGRVGIGSDTPVAHLDVANYQNIEVLRLRDRHFNKYLTIRGGGTPNRMVIDSYEGGGGGADIDLASNGDTKVRIRSNGNVGIGSDVPHRELVVGNNADMAVIGNNAGIYLGTHPTGGFQNNAAIARAAANNYHISGSTPGDLCIASESGKAMIFGVSHGAGAMDTFLHVSRLRNFNYYGADYKFHTGSTETLTLTSAGRVGINDSSPAALFTVNNGTNDSQCVQIKNDNVGLFLGTYGTGATYDREATINGSRTDSGSSPYLRIAGQGGIKFCADLNSERLRITSTGTVLHGSGAIATQKASNGGFDISCNTHSLVIGADSNSGNLSQARTNNAIKDGRIGHVHYTNAEEPIGLFRVSATSSVNTVFIGGGSSLFNAATTLQFYTAANNTTTNGTERLRITSGGQVNIGGDYTQTSRFVNINGGSGVGQLQVKGTEADIWLHSTGPNGQWRILGSTGNSTHMFRIYDQTNSSQRFCITSGGNIGINHDTSGASTNAPLTIKNSTNSSATRVNLVNSGSSQVESTQIYSQNNDLAFVANANEAMRIKDVGTVEFKGGDQGTDALAVRSENGGASVMIANFRGVTDTGDTGRLGVGKNNNALIFMNASGSQVDTFAIGNTDNVPLVLSTHNTERLRILGSGNIEMAQNIRLVSKPNSTWSAGVVFGGNGYGGSSTNGSCAVTNGNFHIDARSGGFGMYLNWYAGNNGTYFGNGGGSQRGRIDGSGNLTLSGTYPGSDLRLKENIQNISGATDTIKSLVGKTFTWKAESGLDSYKHYGFIAQEVQKVVPDLVKAIGCHYFDKDDNLIDNIDPTESDEERESKGLTKSLTVNSEGVTPILVEAMKELIAKVETLEAEVASLKSS